MAKSPPKKKKKNGGGKRSSSSVAKEVLGDLCRVSGLSGFAVGGSSGGRVEGGGGDDVDDLFGCLAELDAGAVDDEDAGDDKQDGGGGNASGRSAAGRGDGGRDSHSGAEPSPPAPEPPLDPSSLPPIRVELLRHRLMGDLSSFLLGECLSIRMPSFERWVMDSKIEERGKRAEREEARERRRAAAAAASMAGKKRKRRGNADEDAALLSPLPPWDPVVPSAASPEDDATERLLEEIVEAELAKNTPGSVEADEDELAVKAERICRDLCRQAAHAAQQIHSLAVRLSGEGGGGSAAYHGGRYGKKKKRKSSGERITLEKGGLRRDKDRENANDAGGKGDERGRDDIYSLVYERKQKKKQFDGDDGDAASGRGTNAKPFVVKINASHYHKLRSMFDLVHPPTSPGNAPSVHDFHHLLFVLLLRYSSLAGGQLLRDLRGGGMQGAVHESVFEFLGGWCSASLEGGEGRRRGRLAGECFASPLNAHLGARLYRSAFHGDLDRHFGSVGDFFSWDAFAERGDTRGEDGMWYECNPPFSPGLMSEMADRIEMHLDRAREGRRALTFVVIVPSCGDEDEDDGDVGGDDPDLPAARRFASSSFSSMLRSSYQSLHVVLPSGRHGYVEGAQHLRPTRYKTSGYDTSVIVLQSPEAKAREDGGEEDGDSDGGGGECKGSWKAEFEEGIREAFASRHEGELRDRRSEEKTDDGGENEEQNGGVTVVPPPPPPPPGALGALGNDDGETKSPKKKYSKQKRELTDKKLRKKKKKRTGNHT